MSSSARCEGQLVCLPRSSVLKRELQRHRVFDSTLRGRLVAEHFKESRTDASVLFVADADYYFWDRSPGAPRVQVCVVGTHSTGGDLDARWSLAVSGLVVCRARVPN